MNYTKLFLIAFLITVILIALETLLKLYRALRPSVIYVESQANGRFYFVRGFFRAHGQWLPRFQVRCYMSGNNGTYDFDDATEAPERIHDLIREHCFNGVKERDYE